LGRFSLHVAVRSANERIFAGRKATYLQTVLRQNASRIFLDILLKPTEMDVMTTTGPSTAILQSTAMPIEATDLRVSLWRTQEGSEVAREPILASDFSDLLAELWRDHWLRAGHPDVPLRDLSSQLTTTLVAGSSHRCQQLTCTATDPEGRTRSMELPSETFADVATRLSQRLLAAGTLQLEDVYYYEVILERTLHPPQGFDGPPMTVTTRHTPLRYLSVPIKRLLARAKPVGTIDERAFPVFFTADALSTARRLAHRGAAHRPAIETGGVLLGPLCSCPETGEFYAVVCAVLEAKDADGSAFSLSYTGKTWARIQAVLRALQSRPESRAQRLLGQVHGHNLMPANACHECPKVKQCKLTSVFVSSDDRHWSRAVFQRQPWHLCQIFGFNARGEYVHALFTQQGNRLRERGFYVLSGFNAATDGAVPLPSVQA
jgi:hypothetical protein